jgi:hypothetical protein
MADIPLMPNCFDLFSIYLPFRAASYYALLILRHKTKLAQIESYNYLGYSLLIKERKPLWKIIHQLTISQTGRLAHTEICWAYSLYLAPSYYYLT